MIAQGTAAPLNYNFNIRVETKVNPSQKVILVFVYVIVSDMEREGMKLAKIDILNVFEIANFENVISNPALTEFIIPDELETSLKTVSISTARGILWSELKGTYLHNAVMPVVYLQDFKEESTIPEGSAI